MIMNVKGVTKMMTPLKRTHKWGNVVLLHEFYFKEN